jgi:tetratricopeptide (TPR) repeat protein
MKQLQILVSTLLLFATHLHSKEARIAETMPPLSEHETSTSFRIPLIKDSATFCMQGDEAAQKGHFIQAITDYLHALELEPTNVTILTKLARCYEDHKNIDAALECYEKIYKVDESNTEILYRMGHCYLKKEGGADSAIPFLQRVLTHNINHVPALLALGQAYAKKSNHHLALGYYIRAFSLDPNNFDAYHYSGIAYRDLENIEQAEKQFRKAYMLNPSLPHNILELANVLTLLNRNEEALSLYMEILDILPSNCAALYNLGYTLKKMGHVDKAIELYQCVITLRPDYAIAHVSLALAYLSKGDFEHGWPEYQWRWKISREKQKEFTQPVWNGSNLEGKTILVYAEQGLGDTIQFMRYLKMLKEQGARVIFETQKPLKDMLTRVPYIDLLITKDNPRPPFDFHIPLLSLPLVFNTQVATVPTPIPYLIADESLVEYWKKELAHDNHFKVGLCWHGSTQYGRLALRFAVKAKSVPLTTLEPLSHVPNVKLYSLQRFDGADEARDISFDLHVFDDAFDKAHGRFMDTMAVMKNMDLIITVDTSLAHLAGALGVPTWLLLPEPSDWRWMHDRLDTPWYPGMRIFRQKTAGDWAGVVQEIVSALENRAATKG